MIRGRGANKDGKEANNHPDDEEELHVCIEGSDEAVEKATREVEGIIYDPESASKLKTAQLANLQNHGQLGMGDPSIMTASGSATGSIFQTELKVPNNMVGLIIGKGGEVKQH